MDDAESDPEYNFLADAEDEEDVEDYRDDKSVRVTSKWGSSWFNTSKLRKTFSIAFPCLKIILFWFKFQNKGSIDWQ